MDEELIDYFFGFAQSKGFKKNREDFVKYLQSDDELFDYLYGVAQSKGYKRDKEHFAGLVGRTQKASPASTEPVAKETVADYSKVDTTPMESKSVESIQVKEVEEPTVAKVDLSDKEKADRLKDVTEAKKNAMAEDISSKLMPVTEKTQVKEVTKEEPIKEVKGNISLSKPNIINGMKIDDDINLMRTFKPIGFEKYKELSKLAKPVDKSLDEISESFLKSYEGIQLDRNISLNFPDPPNAKKKSEVTQNTENIFEDKINNKNVYTYYDNKNNKWYTYTKGSNKDSWTEVKSTPIKQILNAKYKNDFGEINKSKIFKIKEEEADKIIKIKEYYYYNKYLPTLIENWDNLKENKKESIKKDLNVLLMKRLGRDMYHQERYKKEINDIKERIKRNETVDEIDMNILKHGNPDERYDKFWEYVVEKTGAGDEGVKELIKKYKK